MKELHSRTEFAPLTSSEDHLAVASFGLAGSGKSRLICTMPGKVGVVPLDRKTRPTIERAAKELGLPLSKFLFPKDDFIRHAQPMMLTLMKPDCEKEPVLDPKRGYPTCCAIHYYKWHTNRIKDAVYSLIELPGVDSIAIDTGSQLNEDILYSHYGRAQRIMPRDRGPANQDWKDLFNSLSAKHCLITHQAREVWKNDKPSGKFEWDGFGRVDYYTNIVVEQTGPPTTPHFTLSVRRCQARPDLLGDAGKNMLTDDDITFQLLALSVFPDADAEDFKYD